VSYELLLEIPAIEKDYAKRIKLGRLPKLQTDKMSPWGRKQHHDFWHMRVVEAVLESGGPPHQPLTRASITGIRYCAGIQPDRINIWASFKCIIDALQVPGHRKKDCKIGASVIMDDSPATLVAESYYSVRVPTRAEERVTILVTSS
jgi:hypothetical protein